MSSCAALLHSITSSPSIDGPLGLEPRAVVPLFTIYYTTSEQYEPGGSTTSDFGLGHFFRTQPVVWFGVSVRYLRVVNKYKRISAVRRTEEQYTVYSTRVGVGSPDRSIPPIISMV